VNHKIDVGRLRPIDLHLSLGGFLLSQLLGLCGIIGSIWYVLAYPSQGFAGYFDGPSMVLLIVVPPSVMLLSHTIADLILGGKLLFDAMFSRQRHHQLEIIELLTRASGMVRAEGMGALVKVKEAARYELLRDGIALIINDFKTEEIRHNLTARINTKQSHMGSAASLFENMSKLCPGVGMIGTLLGLIAMLAQMNDPSKLGGGMAMAMITTLYGLILGTMLYGPWSEKIQLEAEKKLETDLLVLEGVLNIKARKSSIHLKDIVKTYGARGSPAAQPAGGERKDAGKTGAKPAKGA